MVFYIYIYLQRKTKTMDKSISMTRLTNIHKTYQGQQPLHVLKGIDLHIGKGEFVAIMGAAHCRNRIIGFIDPRPESNVAYFVLI